MKTARLSMLAVLTFGACKTAEVRPDVPPPTFPTLELAVASQSLTDFKVRLTAKVESSEPVRLEKADYELVVDGRVVKSGSAPMSVAVAPGSPGEVLLEQGATYVVHPVEGDSPPPEGTQFLAALRGNFIFRAGEKTVTVPFARSREIREPRTPRMKLSEIKAARYAENESEVTLRLGVQNPNPYEIAISSLKYTVTIAGKPVADNSVGQGERVSAAGTAVFDAQIMVNETTHGKDVVKLIKSLTLPYVVSGKLLTGKSDVDFNFNGDLKLNVSK
jgi:LEA14-like dessication related protein